MQVTSVAILQALRFYCNYAGGTFCYSYVGESFCCNYTGDCFSLNYAGRSFYSKYVGGNCNYAVLQLCRWYVLQCTMHMTVSIVIMQVTVSGIAIIMCPPPPFCWWGEGGARVEPPTKFSKRGCLATLNLKYLTTKKVYKQKCFSLS